MLCAEIEAVNFESRENIGKGLYFIHVSLNYKKKKKRHQTLELAAIIQSLPSHKICGLVQNTSIMCFFSERCF